MDEKNSRRSFFGRVAAAVGVIAAAGYAKTLISRSAPSNSDPSEIHASDEALQEKALMGNRLVAMTDAEKKQRLDELLNCHYNERS